MLRKLPLDTSTFSRLRFSNFIYVDKTEYIYNMIMGGHRFFLSRPRRFGKSLLVSTMKEVLTANKELFTDLWIGKSDYTWPKYGVIQLDFSTLVATNAEIFQNRLARELLDIARAYQITITTKDLEADLILKELVEQLYRRFGRVAILVDEYDSPILKTLYKVELAELMRNHIQLFFTIIKGLDAQIQFVFITGVSSFAKAGLFSGINNLQILTLQDKYAAICGYTDQEVDYCFTEYITEWSKQENIPYDELRQQIKIWYNGYHFGENVTAVYNPFSLMNALHIKKFKNFWFQSGTPTFLIDVLKKEQTKFDPEKFAISEDSLGIFDVNNIPLMSLMFQAGYLTIVDYDPEIEVYKLDYPNQEVKKSFQKYLLEVFAHISALEAETISGELKYAFSNGNIEEAVALIQQLFAHIPYQLHMKEEKFYHALLMMVCIGAGIKSQSEYSTSHGRIDLVLELPKVLYVIEIKFNKTADEALEQIIERRYYEPFVSCQKPITLLGISFRREPHNFEISYVSKEL